MLVNSTEYNDRGEAWRTIDPAGRETRTEYDDSGRVSKVIENYTDCDPSTGDTDEDVTTDYQYSSATSGSDPLLTTVAVITRDPENLTTGTRVQTTLYVSGTATGDATPQVFRFDLQRAVIYADSDDTFTSSTLGNGADSTYDRVEYKYNRLGEVIEVKDQNGTVHTYTYDNLGRQIADSVTLASGNPWNIDDSVLRIEKSYDVRGLLEYVTSYDAATGGNVLDQIQYVYNDAGLPAREYQEHQGAVDANTLFVEYTYDADHRWRLAAVEYTNGRTVHYTYGTAGSADDNLNRLAAICDDNGGVPGQVLAAYSYLGLGGIVIEDYQQADVELDLWGGTSGTYAGLDRFNRVVDQLWTDYGADPDATLVEFLYTYDRVGNRLSRDNALHAAFDEDFSYDGLDQLVSSDRADGYDQSWTLDGLGNWTEYDDDGTTQDRTVNGFNEIDSITGGWVTPEYDAAGNMTLSPRPSGEGQGEGLHLVYDAWNRLVAVYTDDSGEPDDVVTQYEYDGANRLILRGADTDADGALDAFTHYYFNNEQVVETRDAASSATAPESLDPAYQYVWSARYVDAPILRDANTDADGLCDDGRIYYTTDANANVTALTDADGNVLERYVYTPYGEVTIFDATWSNVRGSSSYDNVVLYTGRDLDPLTGMYNYRARWYHPTLGAFTARDPLGFSAGDANLYAYCGGNPIARTDPSGQLVVRPTALLEGGFFDCPFPHTDPRDPNGFYVTLPGGGEPVWFPQFAIIVAPIQHPAWCSGCGAYIGSYGYYDPRYEQWRMIFIAHADVLPGYSPGPSGYSDSWLECLLHPSLMGKAAEKLQYGAYGMIAIGAGGLTFIYMTGIGAGVTIWGGTTAAGGTAITIETGGAIAEITVTGGVATGTVTVQSGITAGFVNSAIAAAKAAGATSATISTGLTLNPAFAEKLSALAASGGTLFGGRVVQIVGGPCPIFNIIFGNL